MLMKWPLQAAAILLLLAFFPVLPAYSQATPSVQSDWLLHTIKESFAVDDNDKLVFRHLTGDVRIETGDTDEIQITAIAQYHKDDPRKPSVRFTGGHADDGSPASHQLQIDFAHLEVADNKAWAKRRIDVGILLPAGLLLDIETADGLLDAEDIQAPVEFKSLGGDIAYKGTGSITAYSKSGDIRARIMKTADPEQVIDLSTLTGGIRTIFLEGASAQVNIATRGQITTDFSIEIDRKAGSALKNGKVMIGNGESKVRLESNNGSIRVQGLIVPEKLVESAINQK